jgi:hypothetical protein
MNGVLNENEKSFNKGRIYQYIQDSLHSAPKEDFYTSYILKNGALLFKKTKEDISIQNEIWNYVNAIQELPPKYNFKGDFDKNFEIMRYKKLD